MQILAQHSIASSLTRTVQSTGDSGAVAYDTNGNAVGLLHSTAWEDNGGTWRALSFMHPMRYVIDNIRAQAPLGANIDFCTRAKTVFDTA